MNSERQNLDGESMNTGQRATGQVRRNYCPCQWNKLFPRCHFTDLPNLRGHIYEAERGDFDTEPKFRDMIYNAYWKYIQHEREKDIGLAHWKKQDEKKVRKHAGHELGAREFTLTYSPQWCSDSEARGLMTQAVERLMKYYRNEICEFRVVGEITKQGNSHIHGYYLLDGGKAITNKSFKRAYKFWNPKKKLGSRGHEGGHHEVVKRESDFKGYIDEDIASMTAWYSFSYRREEHNNANESGTDTQTRIQQDATSEESDYSSTDEDAAAEGE